jgi:tRNA(Ile)-lysidine synthase
VTPAETPPETPAATLADEFSGSMGALFSDSAPTAIGVAVSGGGDSMALLLLLHRWAQARDVALCVVTVNHGLRTEAATEAALVGELAQKLGLSHDILRWTGWQGQGNLQDAARQARRRLIAAWAASKQIGYVALGHTEGDQAETVLMRLARGSGVDGLSAMSARTEAVEGTDSAEQGAGGPVSGPVILRPLLGQSRDALRQFLRQQNQSWADDPSNEDRRFDRIKARQILPQLAPLGIDAARLADVADNMQDARAALSFYAHAAARDMMRLDMGDVIFERRPLAALPAETRRRLLAHALRWVSSARYAPRRAKLATLLETLLNGQGATLHGCRCLASENEIRICREYRAVEKLITPATLTASQPWDQRWQAADTFAAEVEMRALGAAGLAQCPDWRDTGRPRAALLAAASLWAGGRLICCPAAEMGAKSGITPRKSEIDFFTALLSH